MVESTGPSIKQHILRSQIDAIIFAHNTILCDRCIRSLDAGKHVMVEKSLALTVE